MAKPALGQNAADLSGDFKQQDASAWISFDPELTGHRKDVRSAAAKSSAAARKATIARKLALNTDVPASRERDSARRSKKRSRTQQERSPTSASSCSSTLQSRRQSEISLASLATVNSPTSSRTGSPGLMMSTPHPSASMSWEPDTPISAQTLSPSVSSEHVSLQKAVTFVLGVDTAFTQDATTKEPTHFGASRVKSRATSAIHDAVSARRPGSGTLLALALLAAWDLVSAFKLKRLMKLTRVKRFGDERASMLHLRVWHQLALPQNVLPSPDGHIPNVTIAEAVRISLQCHLPPDVFASTMSLLNGVPSLQTRTQAASGRDIVGFFDAVGELVDGNGVS